MSSTENTGFTIDDREADAILGLINAANKLRKGKALIFWIAELQKREILTKDREWHKGYFRIINKFAKKLKIILRMANEIRKSNKEI